VVVVVVAAADGGCGCDQAHVEIRLASRQTFGQACSSLRSS
jgi:hypothetical protein